ncbi:MAG: hypothetical protein HW407_1770 [Bacteroidetes bacterium]|nr:hypothetical protein [Bacteroidota bacterium]
MFSDGVIVPILKKVSLYIYSLYLTRTLPTSGAHERSRNLLCVHLSPFDSAQGDCCVFEAVKLRHYPQCVALDVEWIPS